jgi:hypothetical protein
VCLQQKECRRTTDIADPAHVDDLLTTCESETEIDLFFAYLRTQFPVITVHKGKTLSYLGTLDDLLEGCGWISAARPQQETTSS